MQNNTLWIALDIIPEELANVSQWIHDKVDWFITLDHYGERPPVDSSKVISIDPDDDEDWDMLGTLDDKDDLLLCAEFDTKLAEFVRAHVLNKNVFFISREVLDTLEERASTAKELQELDNELIEIFKNT